MCRDTSTTSCCPRYQARYRIICSPIHRLTQADREKNYSIEKTRRCFTWRDQYYQLDIYTSPHPGLMLLETYTCLAPASLHLPDFLEIQDNVTGNPEYSMFNLSLVNRKTAED